MGYDRMNRLLLALMACVLSVALVIYSPVVTARAQGQTQDYAVESGDTLLAIAARFNVSVTALQEANAIANPDALQIGQTLTIPSGNTTRTNAAGAAGAAVHTVVSGDTLLGISMKYGVTLKAVLDTNKLDEDALLQIGQRILVQGATTAETQPASTPTVELIPLIAIAPAHETAQVAEAPVAANGDIEGMRTQLLALYNQVRAENGLPALSYSATLQQAAQGHADDCAARGKGSHVGSDGSRATQRIANAGYPGRITGENWAWAITVARAFDMWYYREIPDQGPHLKNILNTRYTVVGVGLAASRGGYYMIANFGAQ